MLDGSVPSVQRPSTACVDDALLLRMASRAVPSDELEPLHAHLDDCTACMDALLAIVQAAPDRAPAMEPTTQLGRFTLRNLLGSGNMGTVYTAWDPQLDRAVAIKVLRAGRDDPRDAARLLREAKAMAQVRHPNVVAVYEVGQDADVIFIAMEQVTGPSLRAALAGSTATLAVRLDWLGQIARALGAVHAAGLVHRDLKPDNVFVDGSRAVVGDFGLAATVEAAPTAELGSAPTLTTRIAGTPAYMAPEQLEGRVLDVRADVFAFGVTAWEVLTGARPFAGQTAAELAAAIRRGPTRAAAFTAIPAPIARLLERCVHHDPSERPGSMDVIVAALTDRTRPSRRWLALGAGALVLAVTLVLLATRTRPTAAVAAPTCDPTAPALWDELRDPWLARSGHLAPVVREGIVATMARRRADWSTHAARSCARDVLAQTAWVSCRARVEQAERTLLELAVERPWPDDRPLLRVVDALDPPSACASKEAAEDAVALTSLSPAAREAVANGLAALVRARAVAHLAPTAEVDRALAEASAAASRATPSLLDGELALSRAELRPPTDVKAQLADLQAAAAQAERHGRAALIARAWLALAERTSELALDAPILASAMSQADWAITRLDDPARLRVRWLLVQASNAWTAGDHATARRQFGEATTRAGDDPYLAAVRQHALAKLATISGDDTQAAARYRELLADADLMRDATVRDRITLMTSLAECLYRLGQLDDAQPLADAALALGRSDLPPDDPEHIKSQVIAGSIIFERGDAARALATLDAARTATRRALGDDHIVMAHIQARAAQILFDLGKRDDAVAATRDSVRISDAREGRRSELSVSGRFDLATALLASGDTTGSLAMFADADTDARALYGADHPMWAQNTLPYARALAAAHRLDDAIALLESAVPVLERTAFDPTITAELQFELATLVAPRAPARARELASAALATASPDQLEPIATWLRQHSR
jgi:tetratricopeptide (TPR) repeat protein/predicted Ser/Thr protein kinase